MPLPPPVMITLRPSRLKRSFTAMAFPFILMLDSISFGKDGWPGQAHASASMKPFLLERYLIGGGTLAAFLLIWEMIERSGLIDPMFISSPTLVAQAGAEL